MFFISINTCDSCNESHWSGVCSRHEEWNDGVVDLFLSELQVLSWELNILDFSGLVEFFQPDEISLPEIGLVQGEDSCVVGLQLPEPFTFLGEDHGVLREHDEKSSIEGCESFSDGFSVVFLVVHVGKEDAVLEVGVEVSWVSEVAGGSHEILDGFEVDHVPHDEVDHLAEDA